MSNDAALAERPFPVGATWPSRPVGHKIRSNAFGAGRPSYLERAMNITVVGAGAIGGLMAAKLAAAGEAVSVVARGEHLKAIRERGLMLREGGEEIVARVEATDRIADVRRPELVVLGVKAHQLAPIAADVASILGPETMLLTTQNGIPWWYFFKHGGPSEGRRLEERPRRRARRTLRASGLQVAGPE